jgi:ribosome-binding factor A
MPTRRQRRVAKLIHKELSTLLMFEARDPRLATVTITDVEVTKDLLLARIYFTANSGVGGAEDVDGRPTGEQNAVSEALAGFERAAGFLRSELARRIQLRSMPELQFRADTSATHAQRIEELLEQLQEGDQVVDESESQ